jgi:hypothetical protein
LVTVAAAPGVPDALATITGTFGTALGAVVVVVVGERGAVVVVAPPPFPPAPPWGTVVVGTEDPPDGAALDVGWMRPTSRTVAMMKRPSKMTARSRARRWPCAPEAPVSDCEGSSTRVSLPRRKGRRKHCPPTRDDSTPTLVRRPGPGVPPV